MEPLRALGIVCTKDIVCLLTLIILKKICILYVFLISFFLVIHFGCIYESLVLDILYKFVFPHRSLRDCFTARS